MRKKDKNRSRRFIEEVGDTMQLPAEIRASLFSGLVEPFRLIRKFRKTEPEFYLAVDTLLKDEEFLHSRLFIVRENNFGLIPVLLALGHLNSCFLVSSWMVDRKKIMERNVVVNLIESRVNFITEGLQDCPDKNYDTAILIHEQYQNPEILIYEAARLLSPDACNVLYLVTHKNKGGISLASKISCEIGIDVSWVKKGLGGAMIVRFAKKRPIANVEIPILKFDYEPRTGIKVKFETVPSLFSAGGIDVGTDFLIKGVLSEIDPQREITIYDLACGYGAIGLSLASCLSHATVIMSDADARAVDMARRSIEINNLSGKVSVQLADGAEGINDNFDLVVSNPPLHTEREKLIEILTRANRLVKKGGRMLLVVEGSRVPELEEILKPYTGFVREKAKISSHSVLEIAK